MPALDLAIASGDAALKCEMVLNDIPKSSLLGFNAFCMICCMFIGFLKKTTTDNPKTAEGIAGYVIMKLRQT